MKKVFSLTIICTVLILILIKCANNTKIISESELASYIPEACYAYSIDNGNIQYADFTLSIEQRDLMENREEEEIICHVIVDDENIYSDICMRMLFR